MDENVQHRLIPCPNRSHDLRGKVLNAIEWGDMTIAEARTDFYISRNPIYHWMQRDRETRDLHPPRNPYGDRSHTVAGWEQFLCFIELSKLIPTRRR
ncbi:transposase [Rubidibacter lacunae KORDI 51-2]|uniref:Transposase n=1 Tax=Rubidibacter lacunae KORDI 51-2 TaxID=582515 RepID=U5DLF7_9CHRO|nr:IS630 transposase-related protein [Rubidibacter lacunae]ERN41707.1 transposase [Rubidibacter lacunae KORDI 51-2]